MIQIPIVAYSLFRLDFPNLNKYEAEWYYAQQVSMKFIFGSSATIKFIKQ